MEEGTEEVYAVKSRKSFFSNFSHMNVLLYSKDVIYLVIVKNLFSLEISVLEYYELNKVGFRKCLFMYFGMPVAPL